LLEHEGYPETAVDAQFFGVDGVVGFEELALREAVDEGGGDAEGGGDED
jgi:hypothetical protein